MKAAIYARKSKFNEKSESIKNQIKICLEYAENMLGITEYVVFEDEGISGGHTNRPEFQKMMKGVKSKKFSHVICYKLDRISRNVADFVRTADDIQNSGAEFICVRDQFDTTTAIGKAMMNLNATFAQFERDVDSERMRDTLRKLSETGRWLGGPAPMGYKSIEVKSDDSFGKSRKKHILEINPDEIETVKIVFELFLKHKSFQKVSSILERNGLYSRSGKTFSRNLVKQTINNPCYAIADSELFKFFKNKNCSTYEENKINGSYGIMAYNRRKKNGSYAPISDWIISVGDHPGIISSSDWIKCQLIRNEIEEKASNRQCTSQNALLSGLVVCSKCGSGMAPRQNKCGKYHYRYYSCNLKNRSASRCSNESLNAYDAEEYVINSLKSLTANDIISNYEKSKKVIKTKIDNIKLIDNYKKEIENNSNIIKNLIKKIAFIDDELIETFTNEIKEIKLKNKEIENKINELKLKNEEIVDTSESLDNILATFENFKKFYDFTESFEDKQRLIRSIVKFIVWDSESGYLDIILVGSDKQRPKPGEPFLPLSNSNRITNYLKVKETKIKITKRLKGFRANQRS